LSDRSRERAVPLSFLPHRPLKQWLFLTRIERGRNTRNQTGTGRGLDVVTTSDNLPRSLGSTKDQATGVACATSGSQASLFCSPRTFRRRRFPSTAGLLELHIATTEDLTLSCSPGGISAANRRPLLATRGSQGIHQQKGRSTVAMLVDSGRPSSTGFSLIPTAHGPRRAEQNEHSALPSSPRGMDAHTSARRDASRCADVRRSRPVVREPTAHVDLAKSHNPSAHGPRSNDDRPSILVDFRTCAADRIPWLGDDGIDVGSIGTD
jgi:hypothetical protein